MKRSEINHAIQHAEVFLLEHRFVLPPFAVWTSDQWASPQSLPLRRAGLGWDITDFGLGQFMQQGVVLFTLRNGSQAELAAGHGRVYCEKILICQPDQLVLHHYHAQKTEDIIVRGGGQLEVVLHLADEHDRFSSQDLEVECDGQIRCVKAGGKVILSPGESITLRPRQYHQFRALEQTVLVGEVSTVNDDHSDNFFYAQVGRFPSIQEDQAPHRLLVADYASL
jgi:D-lyxose ketol-isomerase